MASGASADPPRTAIFVLGMHRSGTSALTRVLNLLGVDLGSALMPANADNEQGFWEHQEIVNLHDALLEAVGSSWDDPTPLSADVLRSEAVVPFRDRLRVIVRRDFADRTLWGLKDPRVCRLLPLWLPVLEEFGHEPRFVLICRHPSEVAASLAARNGFPEEKSELLWLEHCLTAESDTREHVRSFVTYEQLLTDWRAVVNRVGKELQLPWAESREAAAASIDGFLDPALRHHTATGAEPKEHRWLHVTYGAWEQASCGQTAEIERLLDVIAERSRIASRLYLPWVAKLQRENQGERERVSDRDAKIARLRARVTKLKREAAAAGETPGPAGETPEPAAAAPAPEPPAREHPVVEAWAETARSIESQEIEEEKLSEVTRTYDTPEGEPRVSIVIPLFNQAELTIKCLESIAAHTPDGSYEVVLVDNGSTDGTAELLARLEGNVKVITNLKNLGFSNACNQGAEIASTDRLLFLNNDVEALDGWLEPLLEVLERDSRVGATGAKLLFPDGTIQHAGVALLSIPHGENPLGALHVHYQEPADFPEANRAAEYQVLTGACLLVRRSVFEAVRGFDSFYWNGCEDIDLCLKIRGEGWKLVYEPRATLVHHESQSGAERYSRVRGNEKLLCSRWLGKVEADLVTREDGSRSRTEANQIRPYEPPDPCARARAAEEDGAEVVPSADLLTSVVIVTRNQLEHTKLCLASIRRHTPEPHEIIFVDNGSTDGTREFLHEVARDDESVRVIAKAKNLGFAGGNNQGLALARGQTVVLLNNDTVVTRGWLGGMMTVLDEHAEVGIVGPMTNYASGPQVVDDVPYRSVEAMERFAEEWTRKHAGETGSARRLVGFCLLVRRELIDAIGGFDERFGTGNCEDDDFCLRAHQAGFRAKMATEVFIHHTGGRTFAGEGIDYSESMITNFERFKEKWGLDPSAKADQLYPFAELAAKEARPRIALPDVSARHMPQMGGRWLEDKGIAAARPAETSRTLRAGVLRGARPTPEIGRLLERHGLEGTIPIWESAGDLGRELREPGPVLLLAPDVIVTDDALKELVSVLDSDPAVAAVGPVSNTAPSPQRAKGTYRNLKRDLQRFASRRRRKQRGVTEDVPYLGGFCVLLRAEHVAAAGGLREDLPLADALWELWTALRAHGRRVVCAKGSFVHHSRLVEAEGAGYDARDREMVAAIVGS